MFEGDAERIRIGRRQKQIKRPTTSCRTLSRREGCHFLSLLYDIRFVEPDFATTKYSQPDPFDAGFEADRVDRIVAYWKKQDDKRRLKIT